MAGTNLVVNFLGNNKLSKTTAVINRDLKALGKTTDTVGKAMNKVFGAVGIGLSLAGITSMLQKSAKASIEDSKSKNQLALALQNTLGATKDTIDETDKWITKTSLAVSVVDDQLRPALATAVRATGNLADGQKLLNVALNVSAGTGKDLGSVTGALSKAYSGNQMALKKLVPGIKLTSNFMQELDDQFKNAAATAANADPMQRLNVIFGEMQETIGAALVPSLQKMANYLASEAGQKQLQKLVAGFVKIAEAAGDLVTYLSKNIDMVINLTTFAIKLRVAWMLNVAAMKLFTFWTNRAKGSMVSLGTAIKRTGLGLLVVGVGELAVGFGEAQAKGESFIDWAKNALSATGTGIIDFAQWLFGGKSLNERKLAAAKADQDRWIKLGERFGSEVKKRMANATLELNATGENFRSAIGVSLGLFGKDEFSVFSIDALIAKAQRMVDASKGFAQNLAKLAAQGMGTDVRNELIAMGPAAGNIAAKGLLQSGRLSEYLGLRGQLYATGTSVSNVATVDKTYKIEVKEQSMTAQAIIDAIKAFEKKTGRKYFVANG